MKNFRLNLILRVFFLLSTIYAFAYTLPKNELVATTVILGFLIISQVYLLIRYVDFTNREVSKFIRSIKYSDFSQSFLNKNKGRTFKELNEAFTFVVDQIQKVRSEKEENYQYLQTVVHHIGTGLISFTEDGKVEMINESAKKILGVNDVKNIKTLASVSEDLVKALSEIRTGEKTLLKIEDSEGFKQLSLAASEFKLRGHYFKLISLQDIRSELERERLTRELEIAHQVQINLLPEKDPVIPGYSVNGICHPAKEVGGDYYDFVDLGNSKLGVVIGDVSGKGLPAAFYMTLTKGIFQSSVSSNLSPREVLIKMNYMLKKTIETGTFVTMFYAILDFQNNKISYARCGHEPAVYYNSQKDSIEFLRPKGIGLGIKDGEIFENNIEDKELNLNRGDIVIMYTDGFTDARNNAYDDFGRRRLLKFIEENRDKSSLRIVNSLLSDVINFEGQTPQYDDMTIISIKRE